MELKNVKGVGEKSLYYLNREGIYTCKDLVFYFPFDYIVYEYDYDKFINGEYTYIEGIINSSVSRFKYRGKSFGFSFVLSNDNLNVKVSLFTAIYANAYLKRGNTIGVYGKYNKKEKFFTVKKLFPNPVGFKIDLDYKILDISNNAFNKMVNSAINNIDYNETLPIDIINKYKLLGIKDYVYKSHNPENKNDIREVLRRRKYEEFYWYSISFDLIREKRLSLQNKIRNIDFSYLDEFINLIPYELTVDQKNTFDDIKNDLMKPYPMNRLIQGDVSCGKTIIVLGICYLMAKNNYQSALMVPTEVLANQHYNSFKELFHNSNIVVERIYGGMKKKEYDDIIYRLINHRIDILIGTHALLNSSVVFDNLGFVAIDEQHKFGVNQRLNLINKYKNVDSIFLSATPIPRTLGLTFFKDLDISSIKSMPSGRKPILTKIIDINNINLLMKSVENHIKNGEQAYFVCPLILDNEDLNYIGISECENLIKKYLPNVSYGIMHGKMKNTEKEQVMHEFKNKEKMILISTTVIEVGINVLSVTMMVIMSAERFGLSTLHQLRGRVGRSSLESYCMLVTNDVENDRLLAMEKYSSGFDISEEDFKLRGPGDYLGDIQSGFHSNLLYSSFKDDLNILKCAKEDSKEYIKKYISGEIKSEGFEKILYSSRSKIDKIN